MKKSPSKSRAIPATSYTQIRVLKKNDRNPQGRICQTLYDESSESDREESSSSARQQLLSYDLKPERLANKFKLIEEREWNIVSSEPPSETMFLTEGHSALSVVSAIGPMGVGKSTILNKLAGRNVFETHNSKKPGVGDGDKLVRRHLTRGIDIFSNYHRIFLDSQPLQAPSVLEDLLLGRSGSQFPKNSQISDPLTSCHMISLQLATFLITSSDYVIIMFRWLADVHLLKLISSAIMLIGEDNLRAKFVIFSRDSQVHDPEFKLMVHKCLGSKRATNFISDEKELYATVAPYSTEKLALYDQNPTTFSGKSWLTSCQRLWNTTIKNSPMFSEYALQVHNSNNCIT